MKFGLHVFGLHPIERSPDENFQTLIEQVQVAESVGLDLIWAGHHYLVQENHKFQVVPTMARLAAEAGDMHVGTALLLTLHHPVIIAEQFATLDAITGGRAILGPVLGYRDIEFDSIGISKTERVGRLTEGVEVIQRLWTENDVTYQGEFFSVSGATIEPKPVQDPRPPIWIGANRSVAIERAGTLGDAWLTNPHEDEATIKEQLALTESPSGPGFHGVQPGRRDVFVADTDQEALDIYGPYIKEFYDWYAQEGQADVMENPEALGQRFEELQEGRFIIGSPETVADRLVTLHDDVGITCVLMGMQRPGISQVDLLRSIELTGEEVIPRVRETIRA